MSQLALPLDWQQRSQPGPFIIGDANRLAVRHLDHPALWPVRTSLLVGPRQSGKSMLGRIFADRSGADLIDNADQLSEEALFHAWNRAQENGRYQLMIADQAPPSWHIGLPDLASRLAATPTMVIGPPDEAMVLDIIAARLAHAGLPMADDVRSYLAARVERDYLMVGRFIDHALDLAAGRQQRFTIPQARAVLQTLNAALIPGVIDES